MSATDRKLKIENLRIENDALRQERNAMIRVNVELLVEVDQLRETLEWYANSTHYEWEFTPGACAQTLIDIDCGARARKVLGVEA